MQIICHVRDINPNGIQPRMELYFPNVDRRALPHGGRAPLCLYSSLGRLEGTICTTNSNPPYLHQGLISNGSKLTCTNWCLAMGLAEGARLRFEVLSVGEIRVVEVIDSGRWRPGGRPGERRGVTRPTPSTRERTATVSPKGTPTVHFPFDDRQAILDQEKRYWAVTSVGDQKAEEQIEQLMSEARKRGHLSKGEFVLVARWKSKRKTNEYQLNTEQAVEDATRSAFRAVGEADAIRALTVLHGVAVRTATALLHWMRPDEFPILDFRVVAALGEPEPASWEDLAHYSDIARRVRQLARQHSLSLRIVDRALWAWQKDQRAAEGAAARLD